MNSCTTVEEVELALREKLQSYEGRLDVRLTRPNAVGQRMPVFSIEEEVAARLLESARICIGWISCRLRQREQITRCFKCLGFGHESRTCKGPDRSTQCYRCGSEEHKVIVHSWRSRARSGVGQLQGLLRSPSKIWPLLIKVLQGNLNRSRTALDLLAQICLEKNADVVIVSEQYRDSTEAGWHLGVLGTAAI